MRRKQKSGDIEDIVNNEKARITREKKTIEAMVNLYCRRHHNHKEVPCIDCNKLLKYSSTRLDNCPFYENKPTCAQCTIHCYQPQYREKIRSVMRYSGPRMIWHHPIMALQHLIDARAKKLAS